jgi:transposase InsO family protein
VHSYDDNIKLTPRNRGRSNPHPALHAPRTNGKLELYQQTLAREWAYALQYASSAARRQSLPHWVHHYNEQRTHRALGNRPPLARVREVTGLNS